MIDTPTASREGIDRDPKRDLPQIIWEKKAVENFKRLFVCLFKMKRKGTEPFLETFWRCGYVSSIRTVCH